MRSTGNSLKRGSTPSAPKNPASVSMTRKIVDATTHMPQLKKSPNIGYGPHQFRQPPKEDSIFAVQRGTQNDKFTIPNQHFDNFPAKNHPFNVPPTFNNNNPVVSMGGSGLFGQKQTKETQQSYQAFGVQENDRAYPSPQPFTKKGEMRKEDVLNSEVYRDLFMRFEKMQNLYEEEKRINRELEEKLKKKDEQIQVINMNNQRNMAKVGLNRIRIIELQKEIQHLKEHIRSQQEEEESKENSNQQMMAMIYALRLQQQEEQQLQYAIQQSAEEVGDNPNFVNIDNMTYEELLELEEKNGKVSKGLAQEVIDELDVIEFNSEIQASQERCTICINDFELGEELKCLPCNHVYHPECVEGWLQREKHCPLCKTEVIANHEQQETEH